MECKWVYFMPSGKVAVSQKAVEGLHSHWDILKYNTEYVIMKFFLLGKSS